MKLSPQPHHSVRFVAPITGAWIETLQLKRPSLKTLVAPITGAWIETTPKTQLRVSLQSHPSRVRGLKQLDKNNFAENIVAPITGAWIETIVFVLLAQVLMSHPSRVRGLKPQCICQIRMHQVAPITGAWIETYFNTDPTVRIGRTHHGCVD